MMMKMMMVVVVWPTPCCLFLRVVAWQRNSLVCDESMDGALSRPMVQRLVSCDVLSLFVRQTAKHMHSEHSASVC